VRARVTEVAQVRHPLERRIVLLSAAVNVALVGAAVAAILLAPGWLSAHPHAAQLIKRIQIAAVAAVLLLPALGFLRLGRWMMIDQNSVRLGPDQLPQFIASWRATVARSGLLSPRCTSRPSRASAYPMRSRSAATAPARSSSARSSSTASGTSRANRDPRRRPDEHHLSANNVSGLHI
jgi:hypothetical protein